MATADAFDALSSLNLELCPLPEPGNREKPTLSRRTSPTQMAGIVSRLRKIRLGTAIDEKLID
ncbi:MAG: hypothetical protein Tsb002_23960 [Wenzhouxiangellaceae bacterium]